MLLGGGVLVLVLDIFVAVHDVVKLHASDKQTVLMVHVVVWEVVHEGAVAVAGPVYVRVDGVGDSGEILR